VWTAREQRATVPLCGMRQVDDFWFVLSVGALANGRAANESTLFMSQSRVLTRLSTIAKNNEE
jgi:hypothetical protein